MSHQVLASSASADSAALDARVAGLLGRMTTTEKIGQMSQVNAGDAVIPDHLREDIKAGKVGSVLNQVNVDTVNELQRIAVEESRLGIPLLVGRDVIHGFNTILPIPLGQAATWNPGLVRKAARVAATEAASAGINWTFAPMIDITRDPRWGRIAESPGEDPYLASVLGAAMVEGFQGTDLTQPGTIAACAKHFAGYGASESGKDYNTTNIPQNELRNVYLPPFKAAVDAGVATLMASFSDLDGVPATGNRFLMRQVLREEWGFGGFVVSDWSSIEQLTIHGFSANKRDAAYEAVSAGVNMEMASTTYREHLNELLDSGRIDMALIDEMVAGILKVKFRLGLFENPYTRPSDLPLSGNDDHLAIAERTALESIVMLENRNDTLPLIKDKLDSLAIIGPLADDPYEQLGTWIFDGRTELSRTPLQAITGMLGDAVKINHVRAMETSRSRYSDTFEEARQAAEDSDAVVVFLGEEAILSGEAHSRANIDLPGDQAKLVRLLKETGKPVIAVIMAGRPLTLANIVDNVDAMLFAWHPGSMGGPAIAKVLFGAHSPSGKLPVTFPRMVGQVPIYYAHKNTGKPATAKTYLNIDDIPVRMSQTSAGMVSTHMDAGITPQYPFGYGLSYTSFSYADISVSNEQVPMGGKLTLQAVVTNDGDVAADEIVQLYIRDLVGNVTRPVRELKGFTRVNLQPGESRQVTFELDTSDLAFYGRQMQLMTEPGEFHAWIGGSSEASLQTGFSIVDE